MVARDSESLDLHIVLPHVCSSTNIRGADSTGRDENAESRRSAARRSFEVRPHPLWTNPVDSPAPAPPGRRRCAVPLLVMKRIFPYSPIKNCRFCSAWDPCLNEFSPYCFWKECVTKTSFQPMFGLPKTFQSFSCPKPQLPNEQTKRATSRTTKSLQN